MVDRNVTIGIVTIDDYTNYGNRLQNFALTKLLENEGFSVINGVQVYSKEEWVKSSNSTIKRCIKRLIPFSIAKKKIYAPYEYSFELMKTRKKRFIEYVKTYTTLINPIIIKNADEAYRIFADEYGIQYYITGSDQVWNPIFAGKEYQFLCFAPKNKRFSFSASFGVDSIPDSRVEYYKKRLNDMEYISVRENNAAEIVKQLTGRNADVFLDPTLLLEASIWRQESIKPDTKIYDKYICAYFLGEVPPAVSLFAKENNIPIIYLNSQDSPEFFTINPSEFLYMIDNAEYVLTDSFHAVAFSIIFHKEFYVFPRMDSRIKNMFTRISTLTKRFGLENRIQSCEKINQQEEITCWRKIETVLSSERERSIEKLLNSMKINGYY